jgi:hypothetical protein
MISDSKNPPVEVPASDIAEAVEEARPTNPWLQHFLDDQDCGLAAFNATMSSTPEADPVAEFRNIFLDLLEKYGDSFTDEVEFLKSYDTVQNLKASSETPAAQLEAAQFDLEWIFARCMNLVYYLGSFTFSAIHFVGSVQPSLMFENQPFHGYNERSVQPFLYKMLPLTFLHCGFFVVLVRSLSKESALELAADIKKSYHGNGQESICLMFQRPASTYADVIHELDNQDQPLQYQNNPHTAVELV